jgi:hypothetical protein
MDLTRYLGAAVFGAFMLGVVAGYALSTTTPPTEGARFSMTALDR